MYELISMQSVLKE